MGGRETLLVLETRVKNVTKPRCSLPISGLPLLTFFVVMSFSDVREVAVSQSLAAEAPTLTEAQINAILTGSDDSRAPEAADAILAHSEAVNPFDFADLSDILWMQGRRQQAAFWFYMFQIRSRAWAEADQQGDQAAALRASLNDALGRIINGWLFSDIAAAEDIARRAVSYEKKLPLYHGRPDGMSATAWSALVQKNRAAYEAEMVAAFAKIDPAAFAQTRRAQGLYVGPLQSPGPALPEAWR